MRSSFVLLPLLALVACAPSQPQSLSEASSSLQYQLPMPEGSSVDTLSSASASVAPYDSSITSLDATWNLYTNKTLGFSMKIPKRIWNWNKMANVIVLEDPAASDIFIAPDTYGSPGNEMNTTIEDNNLRTSMWDEILPYKGIRVQATEDPRTFGAEGDCVLDRRVPAGKYAYRMIYKDGKDGCWDGSQAWYDEVGKRVLYTWETVPFTGDEKASRTFDEEMFASLRFLD